MLACRRFDGRLFGSVILGTIFLKSWVDEVGGYYGQEGGWGVRLAGGRKG